jgi:hypothetical protein
VALALAPHLQPDFFTKLLAEHLPEGGDFPEFGGAAYGRRLGCPRRFLVTARRASGRSRSDPATTARAQLCA